MTAAAKRCSRCDIEMTRQPLYEGSQDECWYCPCCKSRLRTIEMLTASRDRRAAERGITTEKYEEEIEARIAAVRPPTDADMEHAERFAERMEREWRPACEHDTENPWK